MSDPDLNIRRTVNGTAAAVAAFAFYVSYTHIYDLGRAHGQYGWAAKLLPLSVDLLIVAASLVIWEQRRNGGEMTRAAYRLPRVMLWTGIGGTVAANIAYGLPFGWLGAVISAWPGAVFAGVAEMVFVTVRPRRADAPSVRPSPQVTPAVASTSYEAAAAAYAASVIGGNPLGEATLASRFNLPRSQTRKIVKPPVSEPPAGTSPAPSPAATVPAGPSPSVNGSRP